MCGEQEYTMDCILKQGTFEPTIVVDSNYIQSVTPLLPAHYDRVGDRVSFSIQLLFVWSDAPGTGNLQIPFPVPTASPETAVAVISQRGSLLAVIQDSQGAGSPPYLFLVLAVPAPTTETILDIHVSYLVTE
jgi:hypothetical protein